MTAAPAPAGGPHGSPHLWQESPMPESLSRRQFLGAAAGAAALPAASYNKVLGAGERLGLGAIGTGGRGRGLLRAFVKNKDVEARVVCDVYAPHLDLGVKDAGGKAKKAA